MSNRTDRLNTHARELRRREHRAKIRLSNAERGRSARDSAKDLPNVIAAYDDEIADARAALRDIHIEQQRVIEVLDAHTTNLPDMAMIMVETPEGYRIIEHRDPDGTATDETCWYDLNASDDAAPMTFDAATGDIHTDPDDTDRYRAYHFYRLYTQDEVDDLLDRHGVNI